MNWLRRNSWEILATIAVVPAFVVAIWNPDVARLAAGAFGPPPGTVIMRWVFAGLALTLTAIWRRSAAHPRRRARWLLALAGVSVAAIALSAWRDRQFRTRTVRFSGNGISIGGTVYEPQSGGPFPTVVLVHGSAPLKRGFYGLWAEHIARAGFAVLVPDKRGVGGSGGEFERENNTSRENIERLAHDVVAAVEFAATQPDMDSARIGLFGLSQAGWVAPLAASASSKVRFMALVTSPSVSVHEEGAWSRWRGDDEQPALMSESDAERMMDTVSSRGVDARTALAAIDVPGLWLLGANDNSIPTRKSARTLDSLRASAGKRYAWVEFPEAGHLLVTRRLGVVPRIEPLSWRALTEWLKQTALTAGQNGAPR